MPSQTVRRGCRRRMQRPAIPQTHGFWGRRLSGTRPRMAFSTDNEQDPVQEAWLPVATPGE
jgi:hypothetical protein